MKYIYLKVRVGAVQQVLPFLEERWHELLPSLPFTWTLLEDDIANASYEIETRLLHIVRGFSTVGIALSVVGLFALATVASMRRRREIAIRKVLGASVPKVTATLASNQLGLVAVAAAIGLPLGYLTAQRWLDGFAYSIQAEWTHVCIAGATMLILAALSAGIQALRASMADPVATLRLE